MARMTYRQIAADMARRIRQGEYAPGVQLPTYAGLAGQYDVSVSTAQRAYMLLFERRVARGEPGRGIYVADDVPAAV